MSRVRSARKWLCGSLGATVALLFGGGPPVASALADAQAAPRTHVLIVSGIGGDSVRSDRFIRLALDAAAAFRTRFAIDDSLITLLAERPARDPRIIRDRATREAVRTAIERIAARAEPNERFIMLYIGHGSAQSGRPQLALVGPDLSAPDLAVMLASIRASTMAIVLAASASGDFVKPLSAPGRVIITATRSGAEQNESLFAEHFVAALGSDAADADKDQRISLLELFTYARREVARVYETSNRLLTEHAVLDDDGDGVGRSDAASTAADGKAASRLTINRVAEVAVSADPRAAPFVRQRQELERQLDSLRARRDKLSSAEYDQQLEELVVRLAQVNREMRAALAKPREP